MKLKSDLRLVWGSEVYSTAQIERQEFVLIPDSTAPGPELIGGGQNISARRWSPAEPDEPAEPIVPQESAPGT